MSQHGLQTSSASHLEALISKHHALENKIHKEEKDHFQVILCYAI